MVADVRTLSCAKVDYITGDTMSDVLGAAASRVAQLDDQEGVVIIEVSVSWFDDQPQATIIYEEA